MKVSDLLLMAVAYFASISATEAAAFVSTTSSSSAVGRIVSSSPQASTSAVLVQHSRATKRTSFAPNGRKGETQQTSLTALQMLPSDILDSANNFWLATIDADIDSIPTNEFGTVFAGGIVSWQHRFCENSFLLLKKRVIGDTRCLVILRIK